MYRLITQPLSYYFRDHHSGLSSEHSFKFYKCLSLLASLILPHYVYISLKPKYNYLTHLLQPSIDLHFSQTKCSSCFLFRTSFCSPFYSPSHTLLSTPTFLLVPESASGDPYTRQITSLLPT